jgi:hypothetical protein
VLYQAELHSPPLKRCRRSYFTTTTTLTTLAILTRRAGKVDPSATALLARQKGLEPLTRGLEGRCSVHLSYWRDRGEPI